VIGKKRRRKGHQAKKSEKRVVKGGSKTLNAEEAKKFKKKNRGEKGSRGRRKHMKGKKAGNGNPRQSRASGGSYKLQAR